MANFKIAYITDNGKAHTYGASTDTKLTTVPARSTAIETDTNDEFVYNGDGTASGWIQTSTSGAAHILNAGKTGTLASTTVAVAGLTTIGAAIDVSNFNQIMVRIDNSDDTGSAAILFDAFEIQASVDGGSNFETLYSTAGDYTSPSGILIGTSGDLTILAADATGWFIMDVSGIDQIRCQASADTTQSVGVTGTWSAN